MQLHPASPSEIMKLTFDYVTRHKHYTVLFKYQDDNLRKRTFLNVKEIPVNLRGVLP
jgi:hypothetical protein